MTQENPYGFGTADPSEYEDVPYDVEHNETSPWPSEPLPVLNMSKRAAPEFGSTGTFVLQLPGQAQVVQVLQRRTNRSEAHVLVASFGGTAPSSAVSISNAGAPATSPGAGTVLATAVVPSAGVYNANWQVVLGGTLATADRNNVALQVNGVTVATSNNGINVGTVYTQTPQQITVPAGAAVTLVTIAAGTAASIYQGNFVLSPTTTLGAATAAIFHNRPEILTNPVPLPNVGIQILSAPFIFKWESQQPLYGIGIGGVVPVSIIDEAYAER